MLRQHYFIIYKNNYKNFILVVIRLDKNNNLCDSKPCVNCLNLIRKSNIKKIYYSDNYGNIIKEKVKNITTNHLPICKR